MAGDREPTELLQIRKAATYPLRTFDDLAAVLETVDAGLVVHGRAVTTAEARNLVPAYYFPIGSEADLLAKLADLREDPIGDEHALHREWASRTVDAEMPTMSDCWS